MIDTILTISGSTAVAGLLSHLLTKKMYKAKVSTVEEENRTLEIKNKGLLVDTYGEIIGNLRLQINGYMSDIEEMKVQIKSYRTEVIKEREHSLDRINEYRQRNKEISDLLATSNEKIAVLESKVETLGFKLDREKCLNFKCKDRIPPIKVEN